jgi:hypothetical protein
MSRGGVLFLRRGPLPLAGRSQREADKGHFGLMEREEEMGAGQGLCLHGQTHAHSAAPCCRQLCTHTLACTSM